MSETGSSQDATADQEALAEERSAGASDGGPGSHTEGGTGGKQNDPGSGGVPEGADEEDAGSEG
jgi:hypothetical protein